MKYMYTDDTDVWDGDLYPSREDVIRAGKEDRERKIHPLCSHFFIGQVERAPIVVDAEDIVDAVLDASVYSHEGHYPDSEGIKIDDFFCLDDATKKSLEKHLELTITSFFFNYGMVPEHFKVINREEIGR